MKTVGGISLKISHSFSCALIRGWVGAKAAASMSHCAGNGGKVDVLELVVFGTGSSHSV